MSELCPGCAAAEQGEHGLCEGCLAERRAHRYAAKRRAEALGRVEAWRRRALEARRSWDADRQHHHRLLEAVRPRRPVPPVDPIEVAYEGLRALEEMRGAVARSQVPYHVFETVAEALRVLAWGPSPMPSPPDRGEEEAAGGEGASPSTLAPRRTRLYGPENAFSRVRRGGDGPPSAPSQDRRPLSLEPRLRARGDGVHACGAPRDGRITLQAMDTRTTLSRGERFRRRYMRDLRARGYELSPLETELLEEVTRALDELDRLDDPAERRRMRDTVRRLAAALGAPAGETPAEVSRKARAAARARWDRVRAEV